MDTIRNQGKDSGKGLENRNGEPKETLMNVRKHFKNPETTVVVTIETDSR